MPTEAPERTLSPQAKSILQLFVRQSKKNQGQAFALSFRQIADSVGCTVSTAEKWTRHFVDTGLIEMVETGKESGTANRYNVPAK